MIEEKRKEELEKLDEIEIENGEIIQYERREEAKGNRVFFLIVCISGMHSSDSHHSTKPFNLTDGY